MILLDTHVWVWWLHNDATLPVAHRRHLAKYERDGIGVSAISCWEVAKLVELGRLNLSLPVLDWLEAAVARPSVQLLKLTPQVAVESTHLPGEFHRDPADQIIVATARLLGLPRLTLDAKILNYPHVRQAQIDAA